MLSPGMNIKHPKEHGEWAEMRFMVRAAEHGFIVTKPWGDSAHYDFVIERYGHFLRIQVKSSMCRRFKNYAFMLRGGRALYSADDFDFMAAYIIPLDLWYIIPVAIGIAGIRRLYLSPEYPKSIYHPYREAWHLLLEKETEKPARVSCVGGIE
ncbi:MAG TPA: group I intron-associated PD-(D/E)XK endonuclease [Terriglobales bacterium]|nr:group I intron-associated PD-(D/E)XK endonuclease [Terriglobales bacterium]